MRRRSHRGGRATLIKRSSRPARVYLGSFSRAPVLLAPVRVPLEVKRRGRLRDLPRAHRVLSRDRPHARRRRRRRRARPRSRPRPRPPGPGPGPVVVVFRRRRHRPPQRPHRHLLAQQHHVRARVPLRARRDLLHAHVRVHRVRLQERRDHPTPRRLRRKTDEHALLQPPQQREVEVPRQVARAQHEDPRAVGGLRRRARSREAVHLNQELSLHPTRGFVLAAAAAAAAARRHQRVDLV
eukprot:29586-Pelagococcus_subviridis.AAC.11